MPPRPSRRPCGRSSGPIARWALAAPLRYVHPTAPPFLLIHGLRDTETPPAGTAVFAAALQRAGVPTQLHLLPEEGHISAVFAAAPLVLDFLHVRSCREACPMDQPLPHSTAAITLPAGEPPFRANQQQGRPRQHGAKFVCQQPPTWPTPLVLPDVQENW